MLHTGTMSSIAICLVMFYSKLLNPCNPYYAEILEVLFSQNRIVFTESFVKTLTFLQTHHQRLNQIHELDFQFDYNVIEKRKETNTLLIE